MKITFILKNGSTSPVPDLRECGMESDRREKVLTVSGGMIIITDEWRNQYCHDIDQVLRITIEE